MKKMAVASAQIVSIHPIFCLFQTFLKICIRVLGMDGWMTCDFTSFSTVLELYQDNGQMIRTAVPI